MNAESLGHVIFSQFQKVIAPIMRQEKQGFQVWTSSVKKLLQNEGVLRKYKTAVGSVQKSDYSEWLYDFCWLSYSEDKRQLKRVHLVAECEWQGDDDINDDFEKLLLARADLRLMIFWCRDAERVFKVMERLQSYVEGFDATTPKDQYLLLGFDKIAGKFHGRFRENGIFLTL